MPILQVQISESQEMFRVITPDGTAGDTEDVGFLSVVTDRAGQTYGVVVDEVDSPPRCYKLTQVMESQVEYVEFRDAQGNLLDPDEGDEDDVEDAEFEDDAEEDTEDDTDVEEPEEEPEDEEPQEEEEEQEEDDEK